MSHIGDPMLALSFTDEDGRTSMGMLSKQRKYKVIQNDEKSVALMASTRSVPHNKTL